MGTVDGNPVAMTAAFPFAPNFLVLGKLGAAPSNNGGLHAMECGPQSEFAAFPDTWTRRSLFREHRTVVLPDYQGTGIGSAMSDAVARDLELGNYLFTSQTVHPFFGSYRDRSPFWRPCPSNRKLDQSKRAKYSHFWVGATGPKGAESARARRDLERRVQVARAT